MRLSIISHQYLIFEKSNKSVTLSIILIGNFMVTKNSRVNLTFDDTTFNLITFIAKKHNKTFAGFVKELALYALDKLEDKKLSVLAKELDKPGVKTYSHLEAWK